MSTKSRLLLKASTLYKPCGSQARFTQTLDALGRHGPELTDLQQPASNVTRAKLKASQTVAGLTS